VKESRNVDPLLKCKLFIIKHHRVGDCMAKYRERLSLTIYKELEWKFLAMK
jgi:hypothetical protein